MEDRIAQAFMGMIDGYHEDSIRLLFVYNSSRMTASAPESQLSMNRIVCS